MADIENQCCEISAPLLVMGSSIVGSANEDGMKRRTGRCRGSSGY